MRSDVVMDIEEARSHLPSHTSLMVAISSRVLCITDLTLAPHTLGINIPRMLWINKVPLKMFLS